MKQSEIETFHKENNFIGWTETSAKEGLMVHDSMRLHIILLFNVSALTPGEYIFSS